MVSAGGARQHPKGVSLEKKDVDALPPGWKAATDKTGKEYYYNKELNASKWTRPVDPRPVQEEGYKTMDFMGFMPHSPMTY
jgi:hypothetical protein